MTLLRITLCHVLHFALFTNEWRFATKLGRLLPLLKYVEKVTKQEAHDLFGFISIAPGRDMTSASVQC